MKNTMKILSKLKKKGVNFLCYSSKMSNKEINLNKKIEIKFE